MNKYIDSDISDGLKQIIIGFSNLIHEITSGNQKSYVLRDVDIPLCHIENVLLHYIEGVSCSYWENGVLYICINNIKISIDRDDKEDNCIIFKRK